MNRIIDFKKIILPVILTGGATLTASLASCNPLQEKDKPINFLVIMADDVSANMFGCYGNEEATTPNIDNLARNGILFNTCWAAPICSPTRAMMMTGCYASKTGWYHNALRVPDENGSDDFLQHFQTFPALLQTAGFATALGGKWQLPGEMTSPQGGFDEYCVWEPSIKALPEGSEFRGLSEDRATLARYWYPAIVRNDTLVPTSLNDFGPAICTDFLIDFIKRSKDKPFLAYYPMILPHGTRGGRTTTPINGPAGDHINGTYQENVDYIDLLVGQLVNTLKDLGLLENTMIIFTSDNPMPHKNRATNKGASVPLVIHCPKVIAENHVSDELVSLADILPTLAELGGAALPGNYSIDGKSLAPYLSGKTNTHREWLYSYVGTARMIRDKKWLLEALDTWSGIPSGRFYEMRDGAWTEITGPLNEEAARARNSFEEVLSQYPSPDLDSPVVKEILKSYAEYKHKHRLE
jgi:arylsulfatase A-like enzyme